MGKAYPVAPPAPQELPIGPAPFDKHGYEVRRAIALENELKVQASSVPRVVRCGGCGAAMKGSDCEYCGAEHK